MNTKSEKPVSDIPADAHAQARILVQALPHMQRYDDEIVVVKYGGHAMGAPSGSATSPRTWSS